jgi:hypothetical protein
MNGPAYPTGRAAAKRVHEYFTQHRELARDTESTTLASVVTPEIIEAVIDVAFWASLRREEGYVPKISLAILGPEQASQPLVFERALPLTAASLAKVSPAVVRPGLHIAIWPLEGELRAWGTVRSIPIACCVMEVIAPGLLVIKHRPQEQSRKFVNIAVLEGDQMKVVDQHASAIADCPSLVSALVGCEWTPAGDSVDLLVELAVSMRAHGRGGALLVVPNQGESWKASIVHPIPYAVAPMFSELRELMRTSPARGGRWEADLAQAVDMIAGLTAVDGATLITTDYQLIAFGAKLARRDSRPLVEQVMVTEPIEGMVPVVVHPTQLGGTRHLSAVQFVQDQGDALALVASQDGRFTVLSWSPSHRMVHAHRVEALLL